MSRNTPPTFPDTAGILLAIRPNVCSGMFPAPDKFDYERKYRTDTDGSEGAIAIAKLQFAGMLANILGSGRIGKLQRESTFAGIDEYFRFTGPSGGDSPVITHRLRFGSNCPCEWTTKIVHKGEDGRETLSVKIPYEHLADCRRSLELTSRTVHSCDHMRIAQSGQNWFVIDTTGYIVEIALYQAVRLHDNDVPSPAQLLIEIAPWDCGAEVAVQILSRYEEIFELAGKRIQVPNTELFRDIT